MPTESGRRERLNEYERLKLDLTEAAIAVQDTVDSAPRHERLVMEYEAAERALDSFVAALLRHGEREPDAWTVKDGEWGQRTLYFSRREGMQAANKARAAGFEKARAIAVYFGSEPDTEREPDAEIRAAQHRVERLLQGTIEGVTILADVAATLERHLAAQEEPEATRCPAVATHGDGVSSTQCAGEEGHGGFHYNGELVWPPQEVTVPNPHRPGE